jgi:hypothetical protein
MTFKELLEEIDVALLDREPHIREGQFVFNYIERKYGNVAREVMDIDGVDCFYRDRDIDEFLKCVDKRLSSNGN